MFASFIIITIQIDTHDFGHTNFENDQNRVHIISDRNAPKSEDIANKIVCDSLVSLINCKIVLQNLLAWKLKTSFFKFQNGKRISTLGWENWINLTVWKFSHLLQIILQRLRRLKLNKYSNGQVKGDTASALAQLPSEFIDCLSLQKENKENTEKNAVDDSSSRNSNEKSDIDDLPVEQPPSDKPSPDTQNNLMVQQEGK